MIRLQQHKHALGSEAYITLVGTDEQFLGATFATLWQELSLFEQTFSRFLPDSELTYVNERAGLLTDVSPEFVALTQAVQKYMERTGGLYNPFVLPVLQRAGYKGSWPHMATQGGAPDFSNREFSSTASLEISATSVTIPNQMALDFGGIGKGYALDQLAHIAQRQSITNYWLSFGGDILASGTDGDGSPWTIHVGQALNQDETCATIQAGSMQYAVATSGTLKRAGEGWNHLIDPRTGQSTNTDILSATVATDSGTAADVYAKCLVLVSSKEAPKLARKLGISDYVLQIQTKRGTVEVIKQGDFR